MSVKDCFILRQTEVNGGIRWQAMRNEVLNPISLPKLARPITSGHFKYFQIQLQIRTIWTNYQPCAWRRRRSTLISESVQLSTNAFFSASMCALAAFSSSAASCRYCMSNMSCAWAFFAKPCLANSSLRTFSFFTDSDSNWKKVYRRTGDAHVYEGAGEQ